jgi:hypothetical protein
MGDINPTLFLSPAKPGAIIWGPGPTFTFATATDSQAKGGMRPGKKKGKRVGRTSVFSGSASGIMVSASGTIGTRPLAAYAQSLTPKV